MRITHTHIAALVARVNKMLGADHWELSRAYGGVCIVSVQTGIDVLNTGHRPPREVYDIAHAYVAAMSLALIAVEGNDSATAALVVAFAKGRI